MAEELPIQYVKYKGERFLPITSPKAVVDENGKSIDSLLQKHRIGDFIFSDNPQSPAEEFGGTWLLVEEVFLFGASANYPVGSTGGEASHRLTVEEIPTHRHQETFQDSTVISDWTNYSDGGKSGGWKLTGKEYGTAYKQFTMYTGGGEYHNNMPPYRATYIWQRIA